MATRPRLRREVLRSSCLQRLTLGLRSMAWRRATDYGPGVGWPEDRNTMHWLENRGTIPAVEISVDIVRQE